MRWHRRFATRSGLVALYPRHFRWEWRQGKGRGPVYLGARLGYLPRSRLPVSNWSLSVTRLATFPDVLKPVRLAVGLLALAACAPTVRPEPRSEERRVGKEWRRRG